MADSGSVRVNIAVEAPGVLTLMRESVESLRRLLWLSHGHAGPALYGDDGEMQCKACGLDYKRDAIDKIERTLLELSINHPANENPLTDITDCPSTACGHALSSHVFYCAHVTEYGYACNCAIDVEALIRVACQMVGPEQDDPLNRGKLGLLATWLDIVDRKRDLPHDANDVQQDVRAWADALMRALDSTPRGR